MWSHAATIGPCLKTAWAGPTPFTRNSSTRPPFTMAFCRTGPNKSNRKKAFPHDLLPHRHRQQPLGRAAAGRIICTIPPRMPPPPSKAAWRLPSIPKNRGSLSVPPTAGRSPMSLPICCAAPALMAVEKPISSSPAGMISVRPGPACASSAGSWAWNTAACGRW